MAFLKVLNVQQGDCMTFRPTPCCTFNNELFYVDLGNGQFDVSKEIMLADKVHLILTHSHRDHIYGISYMLPHINQIQEIILPYCFNEIWLIAKAIMSLKGMRASFGCEELKKELIDIDSVQRILKSIFGNLNFTFAYDGMSLCNHIHFLNPFLPSVSAKFLDDAEYSIVEKITEELYEEGFAKKYLNYVNAQRRSFGADHAFYNDFIQNRQNQNYEQTLNMARAGCQITLKFMSDNYKAMSDFNSHPDKAKLNKIIENYKMTAHEACLVMMLRSGGSTYLLGGDASKKVFYRLIKEIHADYFKVPHHGSDKNLDDEILQNVDPKYAIISHGNAKFGGTKDPHPNQNVLDLLSNRKIKTLVTNDVIKKGRVIVKKTAFSNADLEIE